MKDKNRTLNQEQFNKLYDLAEEVCSNIYIMDLFCEEFYDIENFEKIKPLLKYTIKSADTLYADFIDLKYGDKTAI